MCITRCPTAQPYKLKGQDISLATYMRSCAIRNYMYLVFSHTAFPKSVIVACIILNYFDCKQFKRILFWIFLCIAFTFNTFLHCCIRDF